MKPTVERHIKKLTPRRIEKWNRRENRREIARWTKKLMKKIVLIDFEYDWVLEKGELIFKAAQMKFWDRNIT